MNLGVRLFTDCLTDRLQKNKATFLCALPIAFAESHGVGSDLSRLERPRKYLEARRIHVQHPSEWIAPVMSRRLFLFL